MRGENERDASKKSHPKIISSEDQQIPEKNPPNNKIIEFKKIDSNLNESNTK
jgi:hypothetical protein